MNLHSFVIRIWQEEARSGDSPEKWRGHILHYPSQHEQYFDDLYNIVPFIQSCTAHGGLPCPKAEKQEGRPTAENAGSDSPEQDHDQQDNDEQDKAEGSYGKD